MKQIKLSFILFLIIITNTFAQTTIYQTGFDSFSNETMLSTTNPIYGWLTNDNSIQMTVTNPWFFFPTQIDQIRNTWVVLSSYYMSCPQCPKLKPIQGNTLGICGYFGANGTVLYQSSMFGELEGTFEYWVNLPTDRWAYRVVPTTGYENITISFQWKCNGGISHNDYGQVGYSLDGGNIWTWLSTGGTASGKYYGQTTVQNATDVPFPAECNNQANLLIGFRFTCSGDGSNMNYNGERGPSFMLDNLEIKGTTISGCTSPTISIQPADAQQCESTNVSFTVSAEGTAPFSYQWNKTGNTITGATNSSFSLNNIYASDAAGYACIVSNSCGSITSNSATLVVRSKVVFQDTIPNLSKCQGEDVTFTLNTSGSNLTYQWTKGAGGTNITGATNSTYTINNLKPTDYDVYSCKLTNDCGAKELPKFILTVISPPTSNVKFINQVKYPNDNASYSLSPGGSGPFTFQWIKGGNNISGETNSIFNINSVTCGDSGVYSCKISNSCSSITSKIVNLYILNCSRFKYAITGKVKYDNNDSTPLTNTLIQLLNMGDTLIDNNTSDASGYYVFVDLINDSYKLNCSTSKSWGGSNPVDALIVNRSYIGIYNFTDPLKKLAADVNNDGKINPTDALMINRRYIGVLDKFVDKNKLRVPDWLFTNPKVTLAGLDTTQNIIAICRGDVNASYNPPSRIMNLPAGRQGDELGIMNEKEIKVETGQPFDLPIYINDVAELGAIGLKFQVSGSKFHVIDVRSDIEGLLYNVTEDGVNIAWSAENQGVNITTDKPIFFLKCILNTSSLQYPPSSFQLSSESIIADINANYISTDKISIPKLAFSILNSQFSIQIYPNPFSGNTNIEYRIPDEGNVEINLYNVLGEKVGALVTNERQQSGEHALQFNADHYREGIYYCVLRLTTKYSQLSSKKMLMITK